MSRQNVEVVRSVYDAVQRRDYESRFELCDEDTLWDMSSFGLPDVAKAYRDTTACVSSGWPGSPPGASRKV